MAVRAKFAVTRIEQTTYSERQSDGSYQKREMRTIVMTPVYSDDPTSENKKFWDYTPSGELRLGTINPAVWPQFENGKEYYLDFTPAEDATQ